MARVAVVTGGNKGIGYAIVKDLCTKFDGAVYLTARDVGRGEEAVKNLEALGLKPKFHQLDITKKESVTALRDYLVGKNGGLDVLVNNAAIAFKNAATEPFGVQAKETISVNFFATMDVCDILFPILRPHARVVMLSSSAGWLGRIPDASLKKKFANPDLTRQELIELMKEFVEAANDGTHAEKGWPNSTYVVSKVGVSALARIQQREFNSDSREDLVINHVHPGYVDTDMTSHKGPLTIEEGAVSSVFAALLPPNVSSPKGDYIWFDKQIVNWVDGPLPSAY
jgi:carbonyl reductase 1